MSPDTLQIAVLVTAGGALVLVPVVMIFLAARVRAAAQESAQAALADAMRQQHQTIAELRQQHERAIAELREHHDRSLSELMHQHERTLGEYARQHQRAVAELGSEHLRIAQEFGVLSRKRHEVYARLYARYRRATHDLATALTGKEPDFQKFSRDDLLRYLHNRKIREREAGDAIAAMDRGDLFAMARLMSKLHWRVTLRDANEAFERAHRFEALNELYLSDAVREAVGNVRRIVEALAYALTRDQERSDPAKHAARQDELHSAVASLLHAMRDDLRAGSFLPRQRGRAEVEQSQPTAARGEHSKERVTLPRAAMLADR